MAPKWSISALKYRQWGAYDNLRLFLTFVINVIRVIKWPYLGNVHEMFTYNWTFDNCRLITQNITFWQHFFCNLYIQHATMHWLVTDLWFILKQLLLQLLLLGVYSSPSSSHVRRNEGRNFYPLLPKDRFKSDWPKEMQNNDKRKSEPKQLTWYVLLQISLVWPISWFSPNKMSVLILIEPIARTE